MDDNNFNPYQNFNPEQPEMPAQPETPLYEDTPTEVFNEPASYEQPAQTYAAPEQPAYQQPAQTYTPNQGYAQPNQGYAQPNQGYAQPNQGYAPNPAPMGPQFIQQRNIAIAIVLSLVTCGIYAIIWFVKMVDELNTVSDNREGKSGGTVFLLSLVTCGIYALIWMYKAGDLINAAQAKRGMPQSGNGVLYLVLSLFGLGIVSYALIQSELNKIAAFDGAPAA